MHKLFMVQRFCPHHLFKVHITSKSKRLACRDEHSGSSRLIHNTERRRSNELASQRCYHWPHNKKKNEITTYNYYRIHTSSLHFATNNKYHQWYHFSKTTFHHIMRDGYINAEGREGGMIHVCFVFCFVFVFVFCFLFFCFCFCFKNITINYKLVFFQLDVSSVPGGSDRSCRCVLLVVSCSGAVRRFRGAAGETWRSRSRCSGEGSASYTRNGAKRRELLWRRRWNNQ